VSGLDGVALLDRKMITPAAQRALALEEIRTRTQACESISVYLEVFGPGRPDL